MKNTYVKPEMQVEEFLANQYVAACGDSGTVYKFNCNAGDKNLSNYPYRVYIKKGGNYSYRSTFHACGAEHEAEDRDDFYTGYMIDTRKQSWQTGYRTDVIVWTDNDTNTHCTTNLNMDTWETVKS